MMKKNNSYFGIRIYFIAHLVLNLIVSSIIILMSFSRTRMTPEILSVNYYLLISGIIFLLLSIISFAELIRLKSFGRILGIITSGIFFILFAILMIRYFSEFGDVKEVLFPLIVIAYYLFNACYLLFSKKVKEAFR